MKKEIKISLVAIAAIIILFFGMNFLKGMSLFADKNVYYATFDDINGLTVSNPIFANGYQVGVVKDINFDYTGQKGIVVRFSLNDEFRLPATTTAEIASDFMGNVKMNLALGTPAGATEAMSAVLMPGDTIGGALSGGLMARAAAIIPQVEQMLPKLDSILASLNALMADPALSRTLHNVENVSSDLTRSTKQLNMLMATLNGKVPALMSKTDNVLNNAAQLTDKLAAIDIASTKEQVDQTIANIEAITQKLNNPDGTLGLLMNDASLYNHLTGTMQSADQLLDDIREHPRRYINISVFGKKEKEK